ncbi:MAG: KilA-N domain-containing protein [Brevinema sp.]
MNIIEKENMSLMQREDGYVNATALCRSAGKELGGYLRNDTTNEFLNELSEAMQICMTSLVQINKGAGVKKYEQGTYIHPKVAIHLGQWLSPKFAVFVSNVVFDFMNSEQKIQIDREKALKRYHQITQSITDLAEEISALQIEGNIIFEELLKENTLLRLR